MKRFISILLLGLMLVTSTNLVIANENSLQSTFDIRVLTPSEYLEYIHRNRSSEPKEETNEPIDDNDIILNNVLYVVMKQEFSEVDFSLTPEYFPELDISSVENLMRPTNSTSELINNDGFRNIYKITLNTSSLESLDEAINVLEARNDVKSVSLYLESENEKVIFESNDAISATQMSNLYNDISADLNIANVPKAWNYCQGDKSVKIGIIDGGIDYTHPDMMDNIWINEDEVAGDGIDNDNNGYVDDIYGWNFGNNNNQVLDGVGGHGTLCASAAGAVGKNTIGVTGTAPEISLVILKSANDSGTQQAFSFDERISRIISYAMDKDVEILSGSFVCGYSSVFKAALENYNGLYFASAGNYGNNNDVIDHYPTSFRLDNVVTVTTVDKGTGKFTGWANYGPETVDVAAPGDNMLLCRSDPNNHDGSNDYVVNGGTSISAPFASGIAALLKYYSPEATSMEIKAAILNSVTPEETLVGKIKSEGIINAFGAMQYLYNQMDEYYKTWDFSDDDNLNSLGVIQHKTFLDGLTINPSATNRVEVLPSYKEIDGRYYSNYLALKEPGNKDEKSIKISVMGPTDIYITGTTSTSEAMWDDRVLKIYDENSEIGSMTFNSSGNTEKFYYAGNEATNLYLYTEFGRVNIYSISIKKKQVYYDPFNPIEKTWNFSDAEFNNLGNITEYKEIDGLIIKGLETIGNRSRNVEVSEHYDDDQYNIEYTHELELKGDGCAKYRSVQFKVPKNTRIYVTAQHNNDLDVTRHLGICNEFGYNITEETLNFGNVPSTQVYEYTGDGENICLYTTNGALSIRKIQLAPITGDNFSSSDTKFWNFGSGAFDNYKSRTNINGITIIGGLVSGPSLDWPNNYNRYLISTSGNYNQDCVYFDVPGSCIITVAAQSDNDRKLIVIDKYGCPVGEINTDNAIREYTIEYTGDSNTLYVWSVDSNIKIYAVMLEKNINAVSSENLYIEDEKIYEELEDNIISGSSIVIS